MQALADCFRMPLPPLDYYLWNGLRTRLVMHSTKTKEEKAKRNQLAAEYRPISIFDNHHEHVHKVGVSRLTAERAALSLLSSSNAPEIQCVSIAFLKDNMTIEASLQSERTRIFLIHSRIIHRPALSNDWNRAIDDGLFTFIIANANSTMKWKKYWIIEFHFGKGGWDSGSGNRSRCAKILRRISNENE